MPVPEHAADSPQEEPELGSGQAASWAAAGFVGSFVLTAMIGVIILAVGVGGQIGSTSRAGGSDVVGLVLGERVYTTRCASCHGTDGEGGVGPAIGAGVLVDKYPFVARQIAVITDGKNAMPAFGSSLSAGEIEAVALYEREALGR